MVVGPQGLAVVDDCLVVSFKARVTLRSTEVGIGILGLQPNGIVEVPHRPLVVAVFQINRAKTVERVSVQRIEVRRVEIVEERVVERAGPLKGQTSVVVKKRNDRVLEDGVREVQYGLIVLPKLHIGDATIAVRLRESAVFLDDLSVLINRLLQVALGL